MEETAQIYTKTNTEYLCMQSTENTVWKKNECVENNNFKIKLLRRKYFVIILIHINNNIFYTFFYKFSKYKLLKYLIADWIWN